MQALQQATQAAGLPRDPANTDALAAAANAGPAPSRLGGLRQDPAGRSGGGARLPVALHASHGHRQRAARGHRRRQGTAARARRRQRRQANDRAATARSSSAGCCSTCCPRASSASATTGCSPRRPRPSAWAGAPTAGHAGGQSSGASRTRRPSCGAWPPSRSTAARIAKSDTGKLVQHVPADRAELATNVPRAVACRGPP